MLENVQATPLPGVRRVITGHAPEGKSVVILDETAPRKEMGASVFYDICRTDAVPASIDSEVTTGAFVDEVAMTTEMFTEAGSVFRAVDIIPGAVVPLHRTITLDYAIVARGSIVLELDDGKKFTLNEGDTLCQRGTLHSWRNETSDWTRVYFVCLGAKPIVINGEELKEEFRSPASD